MSGGLTGTTSVTEAEAARTWTKPSRPVVLIVDDEPDILESLQDFLQVWLVRATILVEEDPQKGLELIRSQQPTLALVDFRMGPLDGVAFAREGKKLSPRTAFVLMTAYPQHMVQIGAADAPVEAVFLKPIETKPFITWMERRLYS